MNTVTKQQSVLESKISTWSILLIKVLSRIERGEIILFTPEGERLCFSGEKNGESASVHIHHWDFAKKLFMKGDIGLGESYIDGDWDCDHINNLISIGIQNYQAFSKVIKGSLFKILYYRFKHVVLNRNTIEGSRRNIHAHYDLGNEFYKLWLDPSMTYSSALFSSETKNLEAAQINKYNNILDGINFKADDTILEIGCGWGGFLECAAKRGIRATGITISKEQYDFAKERLKPYKDLVEVKLVDYRQLSGQYNHVVSIEMFEALGEKYWNTYFKIINKLLIPGGSATIQSITIRDSDFQNYRSGSDFIQSHIFPGGMLPSVGKFLEHSFKNGFSLAKQNEFGIDYAKTLAQWDQKFLEVLPEVRAQGFDERFIRTWHFYLNYCQGGFEARKISVSQFKLVKAGV